MKTLADFKRDLAVGKTVILRQRYSETGGNKIGTKRYVVGKNTTGAMLNQDPNAKKGSWLYWPTASLLEYDGQKATIYQEGKRPLTDKEKDILANEPKDKKQDEIDIMTDSSTMFYRRKRYYLDHKEYYYLFGVSTKRGCRLVHGTRATAENGSFSDWAIVDDDVKGEIGLVYEILN